MIKVVIFDMDGVLVDTIPNAKKAFLDRHAGVTEEMYNEIHSGNFHVESEKYKHLKKSETEEEKEKRVAEYAEQKSMSRLFDGIKDLLEDLYSAGYILVLNTNAFDKNCLPLLEQTGIKDFFDFLATAELSKDKVEKFKIIEERYKLPKEKMLFVTDALGDVKDADIAGVPTVAVTWGVHDRSYFSRDVYKNLLAIVDYPAELKKFINK